MENLAIDAARWFRALYVGVGGALVCGGVAAFADARDEESRWVSLLGLAGAGIACFFLGISGRRRLTLEQAGIRGRPFGLVLWSDVEDAFVRRNGLNRVLALSVREASKYNERLPRWRRSLWKLSQGAGFGDVSFDVTGFGISSEDLVATVRRRVESERTRQQPNPALNPTGLRPPG
jgi:hypothetical protein